LGNPPTRRSPRTAPWSLLVACPWTFPSLRVGGW
jgi:hypothetical protein